MHILFGFVFFICIVFDFHMAYEADFSNKFSVALNKHEEQVAQFYALREQHSAKGEIVRFANAKSCRKETTTTA